MRSRRFFAYPYIVWMAIFIVIPMLFILYYAFTAAVDGGRALSLANFGRLLSSDVDYLGILWRSIYLAAICTVICLLLGYPVSYFIADKKMNIPSVVALLFIIPMWMNFLLRTYATMNILTGIPILDEMFMSKESGVLLGMVYNYLPFMILPIYSGLSKMDNSYIEAAHDLGAGPLQTFRRVTLPLSMPGVITGITMVFMPAVSTFAISTLLGGSKVTIIGDIIQKYFNSSSIDTWGLGSALSVVLMVLIVISMVVMSIFDDENNGKKRKRHRDEK